MSPGGAGDRLHLGLSSHCQSETMEWCEVGEGGGQGEGGGRGERKDNNDRVKRERHTMP